MISLLVKIVLTFGLSMKKKTFGLSSLFASALLKNNFLFTHDETLRAITRSVGAA